ncbi:hypothetical protein FRX31_035336 [Thalictrum thalictroides]|uniref:Uncharacterized protein n=1 Tax=Thalictrum thalictroides TaxID=46969 RepID=A0A7J6URC9_THATH|nr:hypothetical protein FRX31_035336 [Thalictrum thalictroides]
MDTARVESSEAGVGPELEEFTIIAAAIYVDTDGVAGVTCCADSMGTTIPPPNSKDFKTRTKTGICKIHPIREEGDKIYTLMAGVFWSRKNNS